MSAAMSPDQVADIVEAMRARAPLVHVMTNLVATNFTANVLLAAGASPAMVQDAAEIDDFSMLADGLLINIGTQAANAIGAQQRASDRYAALNKPWVLDPVACGISAWRMGIARDLLARGPRVVRGNAAEILALAGEAAAQRGVDSLSGSASAVMAARQLAATSGAVVAVTGAIDYVTDGSSVLAVHGGDPLMQKATATGCALSALVAAFAVVAPPLAATCAALSFYKIAGAKAARACPHGPGHLPAELCDALHGADRAQLRAGVKIEECA